MPRRTTVKHTPTVAQMSVHQAIDTFLLHRMSVNLASRTLKWYRSTLERMFREMGDHGVNMADVRSLATKDVEEYLLRQIQRGVRPVTLNGHLRALNAMVRLLVERGVCEKRDAPLTRLMRHEKRIVETFTDNQIARMFKVCDTRRFSGLRDKTALMLMLETGLHVSELIGIQTNDVDLNSRVIKVHGKGRKDRLLPTQERMATQLSLYLTERGSEIEHDHLFVTVDERPLSLRGFEERVTDIGVRAGIKGVRVSPHTFRHTFAKMYIQNGGDVFSLQKILGHTSLEMVRNYVNLFSTEVITQHARFSPVERLDAETLGH